MALVAQLACVCCGRFAVQVHHVIHGRFAQRRAGDKDTIPLCPPCHDALHSKPMWWRLTYGNDVDYLPRVAEQIAELKRRTV
jgi:hypothetical protein